MRQGNQEQATVLMRHQRGSSDSARNCSGAMLVELSVVLPVFLGLMLLVIDTSRVSVGYSAVKSSAAIGSRYAISFDRDEWGEIGNIFSNSQTLQNASALSSSPEFTSPDSNADWYTCMMNASSTCDASDRQSLTDLYRVEARSIAYANATMRHNIGAAKYPCDADYEQQGGEPGCFRCFTLRGSNHYQNLVSTNVISRSIAVRCEYDVPLVSTILTLGALPRYYTVSSESFIPVTNYAKSFYQP